MQEQNELLEEVKELRRVLHAGFVLLGARIARSYDNTQTADYDIANSFGEMQDLLAGLRQGD